MSHFPSRRALLQALGATLAPDALAQSERPLMLVVTFPPGDSPDITARLVQPE